MMMSTNNKRELKETKENTKEEAGKSLYNKSWVSIALTLGICDAIAIMVAYGSALWIRFDLRISHIPSVYYERWIKSLGLHIILSIIVYIALGLYRSLWKYVSVSEMQRTLAASGISALLHLVTVQLFFGNMPVSYYLMGWLFEFIFITGMRYSYRGARKIKNIMEQRSDNLEHVMIIGAGEAGRTIIKELVNSKFVSAKICCIIDDDANKHNRLLNGFKIVGGRDCIKDAVEEYEINKIIFAIPTATAKERKEIIDICSDTGCEIQVLPGIYQMVNGEVSLSSLREVSVEELLGRDPIKVNIDEILGYVRDKVIMVTGGGGSIGSELCRQIASHNPKKLVIVDMYENNAYDIQQELKMKRPELDLEVIVASVRDTRRMNNVFETFRPDIVYHAAAHKHVPLMEVSPQEAVKNNVFGTYKTAMAASRYGVKKFVLISTDKAVNPTSIMGATKRICEMIIQNINRNSKTEFVAVRFGNVLGSNGSVIPLFKKQIKAGGPVTVTHPDIIRYFMTIQEAVSLVLQAGAYGKGGEIFVLDMGEPVKIDTLARNLIKLSGMTPDVDIKIEYTGLRPGEKLYEELLMKEEGLKKTANKMIFIGKPIDMNYDTFEGELAEIKDAAENNEEDEVKRLIGKIVTTYKNMDEENLKANVG